MRTDDGALRPIASELLQMLLKEGDEIVAELTESIRNEGLETNFTQAAPRQQLEWLLFDTMAFMRSLEVNPQGYAIEELAFAESRFEPTSPSPLSATVALSCDLEAMRIFAQHAARYYRDDPPTRERALQTVVALFERTVSGLYEKRLDGQIHDFEQRILSGDIPTAPVFHKIGIHVEGAESFGAGSFSRREAEVFRLVALGYDNAAIADALSLSESTVKSHVRNMLVKTDFKSRTQLAVLGVTCGAVTPKEVRESLARVQEERRELGGRL